MLKTQLESIDTEIKVKKLSFRPFCGRVTPHDSLGLVPTKQFELH
jgi:hypothetical protein